MSWRLPWATNPAGLLEPISKSESLRRRDSSVHPRISNGPTPICGHKARNNRSGRRLARRCHRTRRYPVRRRARASRNDVDEIKMTKLSILVMSLAAMMPAFALGCGVCIDDKVAATYDHAIVTRAAAKKQL